jgi:predicted AAA+ superfamily ATPase
MNFLPSINCQIRKIKFLNYLLYGGLPYLININLTDDLVYDYLRNIYASILFKDIVAISFINV